MCLVYRELTSFEKHYDHFEKNNEKDNFLIKDALFTYFLHKKSFPLLHEKKLCFKTKKCHTFNLLHPQLLHKRGSKNFLAQKKKTDALVGRV
jgi:hypothetical protein